MAKCLKAATITSHCEWLMGVVDAVVACKDRGDSSSNNPASINSVGVNLSFTYTATDKASVCLSVCTAALRHPTTTRPLASSTVMIRVVVKRRRLRHGASTKSLRLMQHSVNRLLNIHSRKGWLHPRRNSFRFLAETIWWIFSIHTSVIADAECSGNKRVCWAINICCTSVCSRTVHKNWPSSAWAKFIKTFLITDSLRPCSRWWASPCQSRTMRIFLFLVRYDNRFLSLPFFCS